MFLAKNRFIYKISASVLQKMVRRLFFFIITSSVITFFVIFQQKGVNLSIRKAIISEPSQKRSQDILDFLKTYNMKALMDTVYLKKSVIEAYFTPQNVENLPNVYFKNKTITPSQFNKTCAKFPKLLDIQWTNTHWQTQKTSNGTFYFLSAHLDDRTPKWGVRVVGMFDQNYPNQSFYCQIWSERETSPKIVPVEFKRIFIKGWGGERVGLFQPYIITCALEKNNVPVSVSVVEFPCDNASNNLRVEHKKIEGGSKKDFVVCVKGLNFLYKDESFKLIEWIELLLILGADKIVFYNFQSHPNIEKLLRYYSSKNKTETIPLTLIGGAPNHPYLRDQYLHKKTIERRLQEVIPYNDCFYRNFQEYKYVILLDTDEVILPSSGTWAGLVKILNDTLPGKTSYVARNVYFLDSYQHDHGWFEEVPPYMHMLQHVWRAKNYTKPGHYVKGFHDTRKIIALHNHYPVWCIDGCKSVNFDVSLGQLQHYRSDCVAELKKTCVLWKNDSVMDTRIWAFKDELIRRVETTLKDLEIFDNS